MQCFVNLSRVVEPPNLVRRAKLLLMLMLGPMFHDGLAKVRHSPALCRASWWSRGADARRRPDGYQNKRQGGFKLVKDLGTKTRTGPVSKVGGKAAASVWAIQKRQVHRPAASACSFSLLGRKRAATFSHQANLKPTSRPSSCLLPCLGPCPACNFCL
ncbi:hypothetical protein HDV57DRAFT_332299 [Trichoderma longibrachiatum]